MDQICPKIWTLSQLFMKTVFITKCDKKTSHILYWPFWKIYCKVWQTEKVSRISDWLLQSVTKIYYKVLQVFQSKTKFIKKCYKYYKVWQKVITKCDNYYKVRRNTVSANLYWNLYSCRFLKPNHNLLRNLFITSESYMPEVDSE